MARVTVEDCVVQVPNRFDLVMVAAHRARALASGAELKVGRDRDKNPVVALREIAEQKVDVEGLQESLVKGLQKRVEADRPEEDVAELIVSEQQNWINAGLGADDEGDEADESDEADEGEETDEAADPGAASRLAGGFEDADAKD